MSSQDDDFINILIYKHKKKPTWKKYILLEKLLISRELIDSNNTCLFTSNDAKELIDLYKIQNKNLYSTYSDICIKENYTPDRSNFNKMIKSENLTKRNPNLNLINSLILIILGHFKLKDFDIFSEIQSLENLEYLPSNEKFELNSYITFCKCVSTLCNEQLKEWDITEGNNIIKNNALMMENRLYIMHYQSTLISSYCNEHSQLHSYDDDFDLYDDSQKNALDDIYGPLPWELPQNTKECYENFLSTFKSSEIKELLFEIPNSHISWMHTYISLFQKDEIFLQLLFLLLFVSEDALKKYIHYIPEYAVNIPKKHTSDYYKSVQKLLQLPFVDNFPTIPTDSERTILLHCLDYNIFTDAPWLYFTLKNLSNNLLDAAKNLYCTIFIWHRYRLNQEDTSFPKELLSLLLEENNQIIEVKNHCKHSPFTK